MLWYVLQAQVSPAARKIKIVVLRHTDAGWNDAPPKSCEGVLNPSGIRQHLALILTRLKIQTDCDRDLLLGTAKLGAQHKAQEIMTALEPNRQRSTGISRAGALK